MVRKHENQTSYDWSVWPKVLKNKYNKRLSKSKCAIVETKILKRNFKCHFYKVFFTVDKNKKVTAWILVDDITSAIRKNELEKKTNNRKRRSINCKRYFIK